MKSLNLDGFDLREIKTEAITEEELGQMHTMAGSYESLFSKRSMKYRSLGLNEMDLSENDLKKYILEEYTFLKRPVFIIEDEIFIGNSKKVIEKVEQKILSL